MIVIWQSASGTYPRRLSPHKTHPNRSPCRLLLEPASISIDRIFHWRRQLLDGVSLDQLRTFIAAADEGSFSAAGRRLKRAQSVVSQTLANLEGQLGVKLFDRSVRFPVLTDHGRALLADARSVAGNVDLLKARA